MAGVPRALGARLAVLLGLTPRFDRRPMQVGLPLVQALKAAAATNPGGAKNPGRVGVASPASDEPPLIRSGNFVVSGGAERPSRKGYAVQIVPTAARMRLY